MAQWLAATGKSAAAIYSTLTQQYPTANNQALSQMASQAAAFQNTLDTLGTGPLRGQIPRGNIPRNPTLPNAYRAIVTVRLRDPNAPPGSRDPRYTNFETVVLDFTYNPTLRDIRDAARTMTATTLPAAGSARAAALQTWRFMDFDVNVLERKT